MELSEDNLAIAVPVYHENDNYPGQGALSWYPQSCQPSSLSTNTHQFVFCAEMRKMTLFPPGSNLGFRKAYSSFLCPDVIQSPMRKNTSSASAYTSTFPNCEIWKSKLVVGRGLLSSSSSLLYLSLRHKRARLKGPLLGASRNRVFWGEGMLRCSGSTGVIWAWAYIVHILKHSARYT